MKLQLGATVDTFMDMAKVAYVARRELAQLERQLRAAAKETATKAGKRISCRPGCARCCHAKIILHPMDAMIVYLFLREEGRWTPEWIWTDILEAAETRYAALSHSEFMGGHVPCVFLDSSSPGRGECTIYPARPLACRATFSFEDPERCWDAMATTAFQLAVRDMSSALAECYRILTMKAGTTDIMTLPGAVLYAAAVFEKRPLPDVVRMPPGGDVPGEHLAARFDRVTRRREKNNEHPGNI